MVDFKREPAKEPEESTVPLPPGVKLSQRLDVDGPVYDFPEVGAYLTGRLLSRKEIKVDTDKGTAFIYSITTSKGNTKFWGNGYLDWFFSEHPECFNNVLTIQRIEDKQWDHGTGKNFRIFRTST